MFVLCRCHNKGGLALYRVHFHDVSTVLLCFCSVANFPGNTVLYQTRPIDRTFEVLSRALETLNIFGLYVQSHSSTAVSKMRLSLALSLVLALGSVVHGQGDPAEGDCSDIYAQESNNCDGGCGR